MHAEVRDALADGARRRVGARAAAHRRGPRLLRRAGPVGPRGGAGRRAGRSRRVDRAATTGRWCSACARCRCRSCARSTAWPRARAPTRARVRHRRSPRARRASSRRSARSASCPIPAARSSCRASSARRARWASRCSATSCRPSRRRRGASSGNASTTRSSRRRSTRSLAQLAQAPTRGLAAIKRALYARRRQHARRAARPRARPAARARLQRRLSRRRRRVPGQARRRASPAAERAWTARCRARPRSPSIGAGAMGAGIAQIAAQAGPPRARSSTPAWAPPTTRSSSSRATLRALAAKGKLDARRRGGGRGAHRAGARARRCRERGAGDRGDRRGPRRQAQALRASSRSIVAADAILATNTSSLSITALAAGIAASRRASSACISSIRRRSCRWSRSSAASPPTPAVAATRPRHGDGVGQDAGARDVDAGLHRQPLRAAVLRRSAAPARRARGRSPRRSTR